MKINSYPTGGENIEKSIIAIGQSLIARAKEISKDIDKVTSITIYANINPCEIVNFDITKNYTAIYEEIVEEKNSN